MTDCPREQDVLEAIASTRWADDLRAHAAECQVCGDLAIVASAFQDERDAAWIEAHPPTSGQVWWRATMRTRAEAARAAARPITALQALTAACVIGVFAALLTRSSASIEQLVVRTINELSTTPMQPALVVGLLLGAAVILTPFVLYFVLRDE
jgi:hypothetical protein